MTQFIEIINLLSNPTAILSNSDQQKLIQEFARLKESESGWKECVQLAISDPNLNDQAKFFCMQVIENYLKTRYRMNTTMPSDQDILKSFMSYWLQTQTSRKANEKNFLTKKAAQLFALVSVVDFPVRWPSFFTDLIATSQWSIGNADFYLKVLLGIHNELVDREIARSAEEASMVGYYKDAIREHSVTALVESWFMLLKEHGTKNAEITCQTLEVIGAYVSWIEINLIVNQRFLEFFAYGLAQHDLRETTCACLEEIISKGMDVGPKLKLIDYIWENLVRACALTLEQQINLSNNDDQDNCDYLLKFGKLLNTIGENLYGGWQKRNSSQQQQQALLSTSTGQMKKLDENNMAAAAAAQSPSAQELFLSLENKLPYVLVLLNHSDDDISESVSEYCMHYISMLKHNQAANKTSSRAGGISNGLGGDEQTAYVNIKNMFGIVINKTKYDTSFNFDNEGEDEAMFLEYRKRIKLVFDSIAQLDNEFVLQQVKNLVVSVASSWQIKSFIEIENALHLLYLLAESIPSSQGNHFHPRSTKSDCLGEMLQITVTSNLAESPHRIVKLQYFENIARYFRFFQHYPVFIGQVIDHFIGPHGLHHSDPKLRSRVSYLFSRFTKDLKTQMSNFVEKILNSIQDLLVLYNPPDSTDQTAQQNLSSDDKLFLYETVSLLIVSSNLDSKLKAQLMKNLLTPIINSFLVLINKYCQIKTPTTTTSKTVVLNGGGESVEEKLRLIYATHLNLLMSVTTRVSKGFSNLVKVKDCECTDVFLEIMRIFMQAIPCTTHKQLIHAGIRQYVHRMIICIENEHILEYIPVILDEFLKVVNEPKDLYDLFPLINQIVSKYKQLVVGVVQSRLMQVVNATLNYVNSLPAEIGADILRISTDQIQRYNLVNNNNNTTSANMNNGFNNKSREIMDSAAGGGGGEELLDLSPDTQYVLDIQQLYKAYFQFLLNIVNNDLMEIVAVQAPNDSLKIYFNLVQGAQLGTHDTAKICLQVIRKFITTFVDKAPGQIDNFPRHTIENVVPCCFQIFLRPNIDLNDAQQVLVLNEVGQCLILLYSKFGEEFIKYLELTYFPSIQLAPQISQSLIEVIKSNNAKGFKTLRESLSPKKKHNQANTMIQQQQQQSSTVGNTVLNQITNQTDQPI